MTYEPSRDAWVRDFWEYYAESLGVDEKDIEMDDALYDREVD